MIAMEESKKETKNRTQGLGVTLCLRDTSGAVEQLSAIAKDFATNTIEQLRLNVACIEVLLASDNLLCGDAFAELEETQGVLRRDMERRLRETGGNGDESPTPRAAAREIVEAWEEHNESGGEGSPTPSSLEADEKGEDVVEEAVDEMFNLLSPLSWAKKAAYYKNFIEQIKSNGVLQKAG